MSPGIPEHFEEPRTALWDSAFELIRTHGLEHREHGFVLSSGIRTPYYIDGKRALCDGHRLSIICHAMAEKAEQCELEFNAVGGMTMGADPLAIGLATVMGKNWFSVRKTSKDHGWERWIEGTRLDGRHSVLLVDDVVSTGRALLVALDHVLATGASVTGVMPMVDRGELSHRFFNAKGISYLPLLTYKDLGIDPVG